MLLRTALLLASLASVARADGALVITGKVTPHQRQLIADRVVAAGQQLGWAFSVPKFSDAESAAPLNCTKTLTPWSCLRYGLAEHIDKAVIIDVVDPRGADPKAPANRLELHVHVVTPFTRPEAQESRFYDAAAPDAILQQAIDELARALLQKAAIESEQTKLLVTSTPAGAQLELDGNPAGETGKPKATFPSKAPHRYTVTHPGCQPASGEVTAVEGQTIAAVVAMSCDAPVAASSSRVLAYVAGGVGVAAIAAGIALIATDEDPATKPTRSRQYRDTATGGAILTAAGAAAAAFGVVWYLRSSHRESSGVTVAPVASGGAAALWFGTF